MSCCKLSRSRFLELEDINETEIDLLVEYLSKGIQKTDRLKRVKFELETDFGAISM